MKNSMLLNINDFGPIKSANININKLNVVGGVNASGKSFSSKLLFCFLTSLSDYGKFLENDGVFSSFNNFTNRWINEFNMASNNYDINIVNQIDNLMSSWENNIVEYDYFINFYEEYNKILEKCNYFDNEQCKIEFLNMKKTIDLNKNEFQYVSRVFNYLLMVEFGKSQFKFFKNSKIVFKNDIFNFLLSFDSNSFNTSFNNNVDLKKLNLGKVIYIDSQSLLNYEFSFNQKLELKKNLKFHEYPILEGLTNTNSDLNIRNDIYGQKNIFELELIELLGGRFEFNDKNFKFIFKEGENEYDVNNVASGFKQIGILQLLIANRYIDENSWIIIDEPEINLHPSMQIKLAKLLVRMVKLTNITVYVNSHSPYIIEAIEVYSQKENIEKDTNFFLSEKDESTNKFNIKKIDFGDLNLLYNNLAEPYRVLNKIRFDMDWENDFE